MSYADTLAALREARDREGFRALVDTFARERPAENLRFCLRDGARGVDRVLLDLGDQQLLLRPCFGQAGTSMTLRSDLALDTLLELGPDIGAGIVRLVIVPGLGREGLADLIGALPLKHLHALRLEGNDVRCRQATVRQGTGNVVHLRVEGDGRILSAIARLPELTDLRLANNRIGTAGCVTIASMTRLVRLDLSNNPLRDAGAFRLARGLPRLRELRLQGCGVGDLGAAELAERPLDVLDLSHNPISETLAAQLGRHVVLAI
ncbi:MAG TPA: hypothetical protein QGF58_30120 [Myxococcota bacterium]|nr:hypothetical protein [Myxococcota bacterium]